MTGRGTGTRPAAGGPTRHVPVLLSAAIEALNPQDGEVYVDGTFGAGGYTRALLDAADCNILGIDRDPDALAIAREDFASDLDRLTLVEGSFADMDALAEQAGFERIDGIALDIGISSMQLDTAERGFAFSHDGPLDMRMSRKGPSAADVVNGLAESDLARVISVYGEERRAKAVAKSIVAAREEGPIERTGQLADIVSRALGRRGKQVRHPATRTFQALRIFVNNELDVLAKGLMAAERILSEGGRLVVVTFHSLEDRIVKRFFIERSRPAPRPSRHLPDVEQAPKAHSFSLPRRRPIEPAETEIAANPRARSARLRMGLRTAAPPYPENQSDLGVPQLEVALQ